MRHLWSLLAGLVAAPLAWLLLAAGQHRSQEIVDGWTAANRFDTGELIGPGLFLLGAGVVLGLVATLRWSPVGPLVAAVLFLTPAVLMFIDPLWALSRVDGQVKLFGQDLALSGPAENGTLLVLGGLLLMAVFSKRRWQRWPAAEAAAPVADGGDTAGVAGDAGPAGDTGEAGEAGEAGTAEAAASGSETADGASTPEPASTTNSA